MKALQFSVSGSGMQVKPVVWREMVNQILNFVFSFWKLRVKLVISHPIHHQGLVSCIPGRGKAQICANTYNYRKTFILGSCRRLILILVYTTRTQVLELGTRD